MSAPRIVLDTNVLISAIRFLRRALQRFEEKELQIRKTTREPEMRHRKIFWVLSICALLPIMVFAQNPGGDRRPEADPAVETIRVAFVSDTQSPMFPETIALPRNNNELARAKIFDSIFGFRPHSVFHLGDLVSLGFYDPSWEAIDAFSDQLKPIGIAFHPILGNHELMLFSRSGESNFQKRFPNASGTGYLCRVGPLGVLLLNSNISVLTAEEQAKQLWWYQETLRELDKDSTVGIVVVACHHSPYTNSTIVSPSGDVQETFVPPFLQSAKTRIFLSGHAHAAEHFRISTKDFLVIGGGGGLQHPLLTGPESRWQDLFPQKTEKRMFHYLEGIITSTSATFTVRMLNDDFSLFVDAMTMRFDFAAVRPGAATKD
jgi:hypothetical protein